MSSRVSAPLSIRELEFDSPVVQRLNAENNAERSGLVPGFSAAGGSTVAASEFVLPHGVFLVAIRGNAALGCGGLRRLGPGTAEIKRLFVSPAARGQGIARALLEAIDDRARSLGYERLRLDTDGVHPAAPALFRSLGYQPIDDYNGNEYARYWFEKRLPATPTRSSLAACW